MTDPEGRAEKLSRELDSSFRNRADLYRPFLEELTGELGSDKAEAIMIRAIEQRGKEVAAAAFASFGANDAPAIGEAFLAVSPDGGLMYPTDVERGDDRIAFRVKRCPLKDAWVEAGVGDEKHALPHRRRLRPRSVRGDRRALPQRHLDARPRLRLLPHRADRSRCRLSIDDLRCVEIQVRPSVCRPAEHHTA
ncbi:L-2-amino-thiazoline-4-carboxylic acid hydrolase [Mesorhizobium sp. 2RAF45]|uniref:L-2-amino-thiazoline-4-carboxylic acid hydrolase n=1 Tax=Mesorhizobium sp. 2RAF45 TaxID=3233001 RepID=UPI003F953837